jgi:hypothetical protein
VVYLCASKQGQHKIIKMGAWRGEDTQGDVVRFLAPYRNRLTTVRVDDIGIGHKFGLHLREPERFVVEMVNVSLPCQSRPQWYENDPVKRFANQKAQFYQSLADAFEHDQIDGLTDDATIGQLADIMYETDSHGRMKIEPKEKARQRGVRSPDRAKVTGGCSAINATVALRDFDEWAEWATMNGVLRKSYPSIASSKMTEITVTLIFMAPVVQS